MYVLGRRYDMTRIIPDTFLPRNQLQPIGRYLWDSDWRFGDGWDGFTVQLDTPVLVLLMLGIGAYAFETFRRSPGDEGSSTGDGRLPSPPAIVMILIGGMALVLQTEPAVAFYRLVPGAEFIQFPWRLLAIITPVAIGGALSAIQRISIPRVAPTLAVSAAVVATLISGAFVPTEGERLPTVRPASGLPSLVRRRRPGRPGHGPSRAADLRHPRSHGSLVVAPGTLSTREPGHPSVPTRRSRDGDERPMMAVGAACSEDWIEDRDRPGGGSERVALCPVSTIRRRAYTGGRLARARVDESLTSLLLAVGGMALVVAGFGLADVTALAGWLPARAARLDPAGAIRS